MFTVLDVKKERGGGGKKAQVDIWKKISRTLNPNSVSIRGEG